MAVEDWANAEALKQLESLADAGYTVTIEHADTTTDPSKEAYVVTVYEGDQEIQISRIVAGQGASDWIVQAIDLAYHTVEGEE